MHEKVTVIFPMAGKGARFGYTFKPFLYIEDELFIEAAVHPFLKWLPRIKKFVFAYLQEQEDEFKVNARLEGLFKKINFDVVRLPEPTLGPAETVKQAILKTNVAGPIIVCDCDHSINVAPLFDKISSSDADSIIPVWSLNTDEIHAWSIALLDEEYRVVQIAEKTIPAGHGKSYAGVIGCYYFSDAAIIKDYHRRIRSENLSEIIAQLITDGKSVEAVDIHEADFFGDPKRLEKTLLTRKT